jgi:hypothetical protein
MHELPSYPRPFPRSQRKDAVRWPRQT